MLLPPTATPAPEVRREPSLAVRTADGWTTWWRHGAAPRRWPGPHPAVARELAWRRTAPGVEYAELGLQGDGEAWRTKVVVVRLDPAQLTFRLIRPADTPVASGRWSVDEAPDDAVLALNAGQFTGGPWGWLVQDGREVQAPGHGPLAPGIAIDTDGRVRFRAPDALASPARAAGVAHAFQSYPTLLTGDGDVPDALFTGAGGLDLAHRDARLALGETRDGHLLVALTRFDALGGPLAAIPFGLTTPEMAALLGALGARQAVLLDGGLSAQLQLREPGGRRLRWEGLRKVALGLVAGIRERGA